MKTNKILKSYVSEIDKLLQQFDQQHPQLSKSQKKEVAKFERVAKLRDGVVQGNETKKLWEDF